MSLTCALLALSWFQVIASQEPKSPAWTQLSPGGCPDVKVDPKGEVHLVFVRDDAVWYARLKAEALEGLVQVSPKKLKAWGQKERAPRLALGVNGRIHVAWNEDAKPVVLRVSSSADGGKTFPLQATVRDEKQHGGEALCDIACDGGGGVYVAWIDSRRGEDKDSPVSADVYFDVSRDGGKTFGKDIEASVASPSRVCPCCRPTLVGGSPPLLAVRGGEKKIRDVFVISLVDVVEKGECPAPDGWELVGCPMDAPAAAGTPGGRLVLAWKTEDAIRLALLDGMKPTTASARFPQAAHPTVALLLSGDVVLAAEVRNDRVRCVRVPAASGGGDVVDLRVPQGKARMPVVVATPEGAVHLFATSDQGLVHARLTE